MLRIPVLVMTVLIVATVVTPVAAEISDREVQQAIERGVEFLKTQQDKVQGNWPEHTAQPGGLTALCTLALLNAGVGPDDPAVARALDYLRSFDKPQMTYSVALRTMVFCLAEPKKDQLLIRQNVKWLEGTQITSSTRAGGGREPGPIPRGRDAETTRTPSLRCWHSTKRIVWESRCRPSRGGWPTSIGEKRSGPTVPGVIGLVKIPRGA